MEFLKIWEILMRRKWLIILTAIFSFALVVILTHTISPTYEATTKLLVETSDSLESIMSSLGLGTQIGTGDADDVGNDVALATIRPLLEEMITSLDLKDRKGDPMKYDELTDFSLLNKVFPQPYLEVEQLEETYIIEIISDSPVAAEAANMSNKLGELYVNYSLDKIKEDYKGARMFIESQIDKVKEDYYASLTVLTDFQIREETVDLDQETQNLITKISNLKDEYEENEKAILSLGKSIAETESKLKETDFLRKSSENFSRNEQINNLKSKLNDYLISIAETSIDLTKAHPDYQKLELQVEEARDLIKDEAEVLFSSESFSVDPIYDQLSTNLVTNYIDMAVNQAKTSILNNYIDAYQKELLGIPFKDAEDSKIRLGLAVYQDTYQTLLGYLAKVGVAESLTLADIRVADYAAVPYQPDFPRRNLMYFLGMLFAVLVGLSMGFFVDYADGTIKNPEDVKDLEKMKVLGVIPKTARLKNMSLISDLSPTAPAVEAYRSIRNGLRYAFPDKSLNSILVTSTFEGEGKSSVAANLAVDLALEGQKVVLVDLNLVSPSLHRYFGVRNDGGLLEVLSGSMSMERAVVDTSVENVFLLPRGNALEDTSRIMRKPKTKEIIGTLKKKFDVVIIDTPPLKSYSDTLVIGEVTDGVLYVVKGGRVTLLTLKRAEELVSKADLTILGVALNRFKKYGLGQRF